MTRQDFQTYSAWDRTTRIFHWVNVLCVLTLMILGTIILNSKMFGLAGEGKVFMKTVHVWIGYVFVINLIWRIVWGFIGGARARLSRILPFGKEFRADFKTYIAGEKAGDITYYLGHNPLGRIAITVLLLLLLLQAATGLVVAGTDIYYPPFGAMIAEWIAVEGVDPSTLIAGTKDMVDPAAYKEMRAFRSPYITLHIYGLYAIAAMVVLHIYAIVRMEVKQGGGLISAMFTGKKVLPKEPVDK